NRRKAYSACRRHQCRGDERGEREVRGRGDGNSSSAGKIPERKSVSQVRRKSTEGAGPAAPSASFGIPKLNQNCRSFVIAEPANACNPLTRCLYFSYENLSMDCRLTWR